MVSILFSKAAASQILFCAIAPPIKPCQKMPLKIKFIKDDDERILPYCEEEDAEKFYFQQILTARFSWGSNIIYSHLRLILRL